MSTDKHNLRHLLLVTALMLTVLVLSSPFIALSFTQGDDLSPLLVVSNSAVKTNEALCPIKTKFSFVALPLSQRFTDTKLIQSNSKHINNLHNFLYSYFDIKKLPLIFIPLFTHNFINLAIKKSTNIPVISLPIGGHAPPAIHA